MAFLKIVLGDTFFDRDDAFLGDKADANEDEDEDEEAFLGDTEAFLGDTEAFLGDTEAISFIILLIFK